MNENLKRYQVRLLQAQDDLLWAQDTFLQNRYAQVCFLCQQVAEKSIKAYAYFLGNDIVKGHSIVKLLNELKINGELLHTARVLDLYYTSTRYPDALPELMLPSEYFGSEQAAEALRLADSFLKKISSLINNFETGGNDRP